VNGESTSHEVSYNGAINTFNIVVFNITDVSNKRRQN